jgi:hypothetical protein
MGDTLVVAGGILVPNPSQDVLGRSCPHLRLNRNGSTDRNHGVRKFLSSGRLFHLFSELVVVLLKFGAANGPERWAGTGRFTVFTTRLAFPDFIAPQSRMAC